MIKTIKVLEIGKQLPGVNFGDIKWSPDGDKFIIHTSMGGSVVFNLCFINGSPSKRLDLTQGFRTEEYFLGWVGNDKIFGQQLTYKDSIKESVDRIALPENYTIRYWIAPLSDLSKKTFFEM